MYTFQITKIKKEKKIAEEKTRVENGFGPAKEKKKKRL